MLISATGLWALAGATIAIGCEYLYRTLPGSWLSYLWAWVPLQVGIGYCVYRLVTAPGTTLLDAFVLWTFSTILMRAAVTTLLLNDVVAPGTWFAIALMVLARISQLYWR